jgi:hypothetical protein
MRNLLIAFSGMVLLLACGGERAENLPGEQPAPYALCQSSDLMKGISLQVSLDTLPQEQLQLRLWFQNRSSQTLSIRPDEAHLLTDDARRQSPWGVEAASPYSLPPGSEQELVWEYRPVNDLYLYQRSGLSGPLQQQYRLPLAFISGWTDTLSFCFSQQAFLNYTTRAERRRPQLFRPAAAVTSREAAARQERYWSQMARTALLEAEGGSAYFSDQEFFSAGVNLRTALFARGDSLYLRLQLINHSPHMLQLQPEAIRIASRQDQQSPHHVEIASQSFPAGGSSPLQLQKGERLALLLVYPRLAQDSLLLQLEGLQVARFQKALFGEDFLFVRER